MAISSAFRTSGLPSGPSRLETTSEFTPVFRPKKTSPAPEALSSPTALVGTSQPPSTSPDFMALTRATGSVMITKSSSLALAFRSASQYPSKRERLSFSPLCHFLSSNGPVQFTPPVEFP